MTQAEALTILKTGANVFLTGEPGSGKSHTINQYVAYVRSCGIEPAITASTGIAATHIGGSTIHSWSGIGVRRVLTPYDLDRISQNRNAVDRIGGAHILIIDEVSMLSARTLSMVDEVCQEVRRRREPFGGLQVILVGDFFQLPPISKQDEGGVEEFAFLSPAWRALNPIVCYLSEQHRQEDSAFLEFLSAIRTNSINESHRQLLRTRYSPKPKEGIPQLYAHNAAVNEINDGELVKLPGEIKIFEMEGRGSDKLVAALKRGCLSPERLSLKVGARVIFTKNDVVTHRYVNGTIGTVTRFAETGYPVIKTMSGRLIEALPDEWHIEEGGRILARIIQIPLRLAWAMTVHKSQGMSLDAAHMDLADTFEYGQGYVALSRVRTLAGLSLAGLNKRALEVHPEIRAQDVAFHASSKEARDTFAQMPAQELKTLHANFIHACGGKPGAGPKKKSVKLSTIEITLALIKSKKTIEAIAKERKLGIETIVHHLEQLLQKNQIERDRDLAHLEKPPRFEKIKKAFESVSKKERTMPLSAARRILGEDYSYEELRLARLFIPL